MANTATYQNAPVQSTRAERLRRRRARRRGRRVEVAFEEKKMTGFLFYIMLGMALAKDALDPILSFTIILSVLVPPLTVLVFTILYLYRKYEGAPFSIKIFVTYILAIMIELLPLVGMLPGTVLKLLLTRYFINHDIKKRNKEKKKAFNKTGRLRA